MAIPAGVKDPATLRAWINAHYSPAQRDAVYRDLYVKWIGPTNRPFVPVAAPTPAPTTPVASAPAAAPPAAAPAPAPKHYTSLGQEARISGIDTRLATSKDRWNPQRTSIYAEGTRSLTDQGYADTATSEVAATDADGNVSYRIVMGPDGQLYRQAKNSTDNAMNAAGTLFGSANREQQASQAEGLNNARARIERDLAARQDQTISDQSTEVAGLRSDAGAARGDYTDWQAEQARNDIPAPTPASSTPAGGADYGEYASNPNRQTLDQRYGVGKYKVTRAGNGKWVVRGV